MPYDLFKAAFLGIVEGLTEFIPVSSTGHLLLIGHFLGFDDEEFGKTFTVLIQLGAILAVLAIYFGKLWSTFIALPSDPDARRFAAGVLIAFLPAAVIGALAHGFIKGVLFNVYVVCVSLIIGGFILFLVDRMNLRPRHHDATRFPLLMYLGIGICQCLAMIPGVSRSGATITAALLFGADRRSAAEFSFYLAIPTMAGAFAYDLFKSWHEMTVENTLIVATGFVASFICGYIVVRSLLAYVQQHGFWLFAWWRIIVGTIGLAAITLVG